MRVLLVGATGVLGRQTLAELRARGHQVVALARSTEAEQKLAEQGVETARGDLFDPAALERGAQGCEAVFHLATRIPRKPLPKAEDFAENDRIRTDGTRLLATAALKAGARALLFQSIAFIYGDRGGEIVTEDTRPLDHPLAATALEGERTTLDSGLRGVVLRGGQFFQRGSFHTDWAESELRQRRLPLVGKGEAYLNPVHPRDLARAFVRAAEDEKARGIYHVASEPVEMRVFFDEWARRLGARPPRRLPAWLARMVLGDRIKMFTASYRVSSERIRRELGFEFQFPTYREILDDIAPV